MQKAPSSIAKYVYFMLVLKNIIDYKLPATTILYQVAGNTIPLTIQKHEKGPRHLKRILLLQHVWDNHKGYVGQLLDEYAIPYDVIDVEQNSIPAPQPYGAIIAFGGSQHLYMVDQYPYLVQERALLHTAVEQDIPFLGICLGGQLLANTFGGKVRKHTVAEFGFLEVQLTDEGRRDPLFSALPGYQSVFHWHEDTFDLPAGATLLATSNVTTNQAFRYGHRAYGLQYHIEIDDTTLNTWLYDPECKQSILETQGMQIYRATEQTRATLLPAYHKHSRIMIENFLRISELR
jgi:GMP synthase-like glutamine amidotransferase